MSSQADSPDTLPFGPFDPTRHRTLELGLRHWVEEQTGLDLRYVEQLYTFGDQYRDLPDLHDGPRVVSIAYLALTHESDVAGSGDADWQDWYRFLPWEDCRDGTSQVVDKIIRPVLRRWISQSNGRSLRNLREERVSVCFGLKAPAVLDPIRTLERYELLYEVGLVPEVHRDHKKLWQLESAGEIAPDPSLMKTAQELSPPMALDNRRILATALSRIRGKLAYRPVVFELLPKDFTLLQLQRVAEALAGVRLHKQNFRRMLFTSELVEPTGRRDSSGRGRPAELYRFRREVMRERAAVGVGLPNLRAAG